MSTRVLEQRFGGTHVPHSRDTEHFDPTRHDPDACRRALGLSDFKVLLFAGTPRAHKGLEDLLEAIELSERDDLRLVLVGGRRTDYADELVARWDRWIVNQATPPKAATVTATAGHAPAAANMPRGMRHMMP